MMCFDYTIGVVLCGAAIMGITSGILGCFAFLRQQSLLGDAIAHASLPGIVSMFLITHTTSSSLLLCGGAFAGVISIVCLQILMHTTRLKKDAILGIILSVFFGIGLVLLTITQKQPISNQSILNKFLFGSAATLLIDDIFIMGLLALIIILCIITWWKQFIFVTFDRPSAQTVGYAVTFYECIINFLLVLAIVSGLQTVGVVLMSTMLIAPAVAARQWVTHAHTMVIVSGFFGACSAIFGVLASSYLYHIPTGPAIVIMASIIVLISLIASRKNYMSLNKCNNT